MGILERLIAHHKKNATRSVNFDFFQGCMAAAALVTTSDGRVDAREDAMLRTLLTALSEFKLYNKRHGLEIYEGFKSDLLKNKEVGEKKASEAISAVKEEREWSAILGATMLTMSGADGVVHEAEDSAMAKVMALLELNMADIEAFDVSIRDAQFD